MKILNSIFEQSPYITTKEAIDSVNDVYKTINEVIKLSIPLNEELSKLITRLDIEAINSFTEAGLNKEEATTLRLSAHKIFLSLIND